MEPEIVAAARRFTRFYTRQTELLNEGFLESPFSLTEGRVLYELNARGACSASDLTRDLGLDAGYLSRMLKRFEEKGLCTREHSAQDARQSTLRITEAGRKAFAPLDALSQTQWEARLGRLTSPDRTQLAAAMGMIESLLGEGHSREISLRGFAIGDLGWIARRQGMLYAEEYGWDGTFEALVAEILVDYVRKHDPANERAWIAERDGAILGSVFLVRQEEKVAKLRLLYVEPETRGTGLGTRLVQACIDHARALGYAKLTLWTNDCLAAARHIYVRAGFTLVEEETHHSFGVDLVGQYWSLDL